MKGNKRTLCAFSAVTFDMRIKFLKNIEIIFHYSLHAVYFAGKMLLKVSNMILILIPNKFLWL